LQLTVDRFSVLQNQKSSRGEGLSMSGFERLDRLSASTAREVARLKANRMAIVGTAPGR
jgi:hypothetical protein